MASRLLSIVAGLVLLMAAGCSDQELTEIVLVVDTNLSSPDEMDSIRIMVSGPTEMQSPITAQLTGADAAELPLTLGLEHGGGPLQPVTVQVSGLLAGQPTSVIERTVRTGFVRNERRLLRITLLRDCVGMVCGAEETCGEGGTCRSIDVAAETLPDFDGTIPILDGSPGLDAGSDGGVEVDAPMDAGTPPVVVEVVGGFHCTCARIEDGTVRCWGANENGQLGNGMTAERHLSAQTVIGLTDAKSISMGVDNACSVRNTNEVVCWGANEYGQLGDGSTMNRVTPVRATDATQVSAGSVHACAVDLTNTVLCWGRNGYSMLGDGTDVNRGVPGPISGAYQADHVSSGNTHSCALLTSGEVYCWGDNEFGQVGDGTGTLVHPVPVKVIGLPDPSTDPVTKVTTATEHSCALLRSGTVMCWGRNDAGQIGDGTTAAERRAPVAIDQSETGMVADIITDSFSWHSCLIDTSKRLWCWGANVQGQIGDGTNVARHSPVLQTALTEVVAAGMGRFHTCAVVEGGALHCWGSNEDGQLGNGLMEAEAHRRPVAVTAW